MISTVLCIDFYQTFAINGFEVDYSFQTENFQKQFDQRFIDPMMGFPFLLLLFQKTNHSIDWMTISTKKNRFHDWFEKVYETSNWNRSQTNGFDQIN